MAGFEVTTEGALTVYLFALGTRSGVEKSWQRRRQRWFLTDAATLERWLPVVGDVLAFAGGLVGIAPLPFVIFVWLGKALRYGAAAWLTLAA